MADPASLWPVVVGGLLTMAGGVIGSGVAVALKLVESRDAKKKRRAEKFEELVQLVLEHHHWLHRKKDIETFGRQGEIGISPFAKIEAITVIYFPTLSDVLVELSRGGDVFELWILKAGQRRLKGEMANINDGLEEAYEPYLEARKKLRDRLSKFANEEFQ